MHRKKANDLSTPHGFSLIEAAIVLGVIGLVIGGIWIAAADLTAKQRLNEAAAGTLTTIENARRLFPAYSYPTTTGTTIFIGETMHAAGAYPPGWVASLHQAISPEGVRVEITQSCASTCPALSFKFWGPGQTTYPTSLSVAECTYLMKRLINLVNSRNDFLHILINNAAPVIYYKPVDPAAVQCGTDTQQISFRFSPS